MEVELDMFSGVPNPRWTLSEHQARELARLLHAVPPTDAEPPGLGYRGFVLHNPDEEFGLRLLVRVDYRTQRHEGVREAEELLTGLARQRGFGAVLDQLRGDG